MRWTVVVPGALLPAPIAADVLAEANAPWLKRVLPRARLDDTASADADAPHLSWLWQQFGGRGDPVTAPFALRALDGEADPGAQCWHVDPVHFAFARDHVLVAPLDEGLAPGEEIALAAHLRAALQESPGLDGARLHLRGGQWLLTVERAWSLRATSLDGALGQSAQEHWPSGSDAAAWRKLLTEVQMCWHQEACNEAREALGRRAVNALWLHGGGAWSALPARPFTAVVANDAVLRGWALAAGLPRTALYDDDAAAEVRSDATVSIRRDLLAPARFDAWGQWLERLAALDAALSVLHGNCLAAGYDELVLVLGGRRQVRIIRIRRGDFWRGWRRTPLATLLAEAG
jgi:hypothetical protein